MLCLITNIHTYMYISKFRNKERDMCPGPAGICTCRTGLLCCDSELVLPVHLKRSSDITCIAVVVI